MEISTHLQNHLQIICFRSIWNSDVKLLPRGNSNIIVIQPINSPSPQKATNPLMKSFRRQHVSIKVKKKNNCKCLTLWGRGHRLSKGPPSHCNIPWFCLLRRGSSTTISQAQERCHITVSQPSNLHSWRPENGIRSCSEAMTLPQPQEGPGQ